MTRKRTRPNELTDREHFNSIAPLYVKKDETPSSRVARRFRLASTLDATGIGQTFDALEVGCGAGYSVDYLGDRLSSYVGVDHSEALISVAKKRHESTPYMFIAGRAQDLDFTNKFDIAFVIGVLHHLQDVETVLEAMFNALKPGGWIVVNEPQPDNPIVSVARRLRKRVDTSYQDDQVEFRPVELESMITNVGFGNVCTHPQGYLSTPFAEVPLPFPMITSRLASVAVRADVWLSSRAVWPKLAWNCIATGVKP